MTTVSNLLVSRHLCLSLVRLRWLCLPPSVLPLELQENVAAGLPKRLRPQPSTSTGSSALFGQLDKNDIATKHFARRLLQLSMVQSVQKINFRSLIQCHQIPSKH